MESLQHQNSNHSGSLEGFMGGIKGISELEAQLQFREKEFQELKMQFAQRESKYKTKKKHLKDELELQKEQVLNLQRANLERDVYKSLGDENQKLKAKVSELDSLIQKRNTEMRALQQDLNEHTTYKNAYDYMKEELVKVKSDYHMQSLELEKVES